MIIIIILVYQNFRNNYLLILTSTSNLLALLSKSSFGVSTFKNVTSFITGLPFNISFNKDINATLHFSLPNIRLNMKLVIPFFHIP